MVQSTLPLAVVISAVDRLTGPLNRMGRRISRFGKSLTKVGRGMTIGLTAPILLFGAAVLSSSAKFEEGMLRVQALTGKTGEELAEVTELAKSLGSSTVFSATEAADAMGNLALAGFDTNQILAATPPILDLATAASIDLAQAAEIAAGGLNAYGFEADQATRVADVLTKTFTSSATTLEDLGLAFVSAAPVARGMGIEFEELSATLAILGNNMFRGEMAGTAIRGALARLANATPQAVKRLEGLGIPLDKLLDGRGNVLSLTNTVRQLAEAGATTGDILKIFGLRAGPAMAALVAEGADELVRMTDLLRNSTGTAARIAAVRMEGAAGGVRAMKSAFEGLTIAIGDSGLLQWFTDAIGKLTKWFQGITKTNPELLKIGTIAALVAAALGPLILVAGAAVTAFGGLATAAGVLGTALTFLWANPIGLVIGSIVGLIAFGVLLVKNWDAIVDSAKAIAFWVGDKLTQAFDFLALQIGSLVDLVPQWLIDLVTGGASIIGDFLGIGGGGETIARGPAIAAGNTTSERITTSRVEVILPNIPDGARVETTGAFEDVELGLSMVFPT